MNPEDELRNALGDRAAEVEPGNDSYARLAQRVTDAQQIPPPWWQSPRLLWLSAAGTGMERLNQEFGNPLVGQGKQWRCSSRHP